MFDDGSDDYLAATPPPPVEEPPREPPPRPVHRPPPPPPAAKSEKFVPQITGETLSRQKSVLRPVRPVANRPPTPTPLLMDARMEDLLNRAREMNRDSRPESDYNESWEGLPMYNLSSQYVRETSDSTSVARESGHSSAFVSFVPPVVRPPPGYNRPSTPYYPENRPSTSFAHATPIYESAYGPLDGPTGQPATRRVRPSSLPLSKKTEKILCVKLFLDAHGQLPPRPQQPLPENPGLTNGFAKRGTRFL